MARAVYSTRFFAVSGRTTNGLAAYTVPAGFVAIVSDFDVTMTSGAPATILLYDGVAGSGFVPITLSAILTPGRWSGHQVWNAGESFGWALTGGTWNIRCSGYLLTA